MPTICRWVVALLLLTGLAVGSAGAQYTAKSTTEAPPKELKETIQPLLSPESAQFLDAKGKVLAEVWLHKELPVKATAQQIKKGLTYREVPETTLMGAIRFSQPMTDYRKQTIKPGVYTLRLGNQPTDGDHMGTAAYNEFCLLVPAADDKDPAPMQLKDLQEVSTKASGTAHPAVLLLFPNDKPAAVPQALDKGNGHWILGIKGNTKVGAEKAPLGIGLTLIGVSPSA